MFSKHRFRPETYELSLSGETFGEISRVDRLSSTQEDNEPDHHPLEDKVIFNSMRGGRGALWVSIEGRPAEVFHEQKGVYMGSPRWSHDGRWVVLDSNLKGDWDVLLIDESGENRAPLTSHEADDVVPSWSRDGLTVYFGSNRSGAHQVWKVDLRSRHKTQLTTRGGFVAMESWDGSKIFYTQSDELVTSLWERDLRTGAERMPFDRVARRNIEPGEAGIYLVAQSEDNSGTDFEVVLLDPKTGALKRLVKLPKHLSPDHGISLSPDGKSLLLTLVPQEESDVMLGVCPSKNGA